MKYYKCQDCGAITQEEAIGYCHFSSDYFEAKDLFVTMDIPVHKGKEACPECGSTDLTVLNACDFCGEPTEGEEYELCPTCRQIAKNIGDYAKRTWQLGFSEMMGLLDTYENEQE